MARSRRCNWTPSGPGGFQNSSELALDVAAQGVHKADIPLRQQGQALEHPLRQLFIGWGIQFRQQGFQPGTQGAKTGGFRFFGRAVGAGTGEPR